MPPEIRREIAQCLSTPDLVNFTMASKKHWDFFKPILNVRKLLNHIVRGEYDSVQSILKNDRSLIFKRGRVTDCSGRIFENISAFEYALWALDKHMWSMMLECLPQNEEGKKILAMLLSQYHNVNTKGVTYRLNGETVTESHFDFKNTIIKELQMQVDSIHAPGDKDWVAIDKQWREGVGSSQKNLPMHVVYEYCSDMPFYPMPEFTSRPKSSKKFYNWITEKMENWFEDNSKLGSDFAIYKARQTTCGSGGAWGRVPTGMLSVFVADLDLAAIETLCEVRTKEFINLESQLEEQMMVDNQHKARQNFPKTIDPGIFLLSI
nr:MULTISPECIES: F-box protein [unclassified Legionella]